MDEARRTVDLSFQYALRLITAQMDELGALDAAAGDGDHGTTMVRGLRAANEALIGLPDDASAGQALVSAGSAFADAAGGASGALYGLFFVTAGQQLGDGPFDATSVVAAVSMAGAAVSRLGKAEVGDKTFVDTLAPFIDSLTQTAGEGMGLSPAWQQAMDAAKQGMTSTAGMVARRGRASRLGERSRKGFDPGAVSMAYLLQAAGEAIAERCTKRSAT